ncbi:MAG: DUF6265 family protein [Pseudomonadota bacterium]
MIHQTGKILLVTLMISSAPVAHADTCSSLKDLNWLIGDWFDPGEQKTFNESWIYSSGDSYSGKGWTMETTTGEISFSESMRILRQDGGIYYLVKLPENDGEVGFKLVRCPDQEAIFENREHDFPQRLHYELIAKDQLQVTVSGEEGKSFVLDLQAKVPAGEGEEDAAPANIN